MTTHTISYSVNMDAFKPQLIDAVNYETRCKKENCFEIIPYDRPVKMYLDVDIKTDIEEDEDGDTLMQEMPRLRGQVMNIISDYFGELYDHKQVSITTSHSPYYRPVKSTKNAEGKSVSVLADKYVAKLSFHFVFNNMTALLAHQLVIVNELNAFAALHADSEDMATLFRGQMFDTAPYSKGQKIRSVYASKPLESRPLIIEKGTFEMSCITAFIPEDAQLITREIPQKPIRATTDEIPMGDDKDRRIFYRHIAEGLLTKWATPYKEWILIGWAIKNAFDEFKMWDDFSKLAGKAYDSLGVRDAWDAMERKNDGVGMGTINHYAKQTDEQKARHNIQMETDTQTKTDLENIRAKIIAEIEEETDSESESGASEASDYVPTSRTSYEELYAEQQVKMQTAYIKSQEAMKFVKRTPISDYEFAMLFIKVFGKRFITCNENTYYFTGYVWKTCDKKRTDLHKFLAREFYMFVGKMFAYWETKLRDQLAKTTDEEKQKEVQNVIKLVHDNLTKLYDRLTGHKSRGILVDEIVIHSTDNDVEFNKNNHLFAFKNAVFDLRKNEQIIPDPEHYISLYADYEYDPTYSPDRIKELNAVFETIHQNSEIRNYYLSVMATGLIGDHLQYFFVFTGVGGNGKGVSNKLFMKTISNYGYKMPNTLFTQDLKEGANPEVANMHQKRFCVAQEPARGTKLRMENVKEFTGENQLNARQLYSGKTETLMNNTLCLEANKIPHTNEVGNAVSRRLRIIPFLTTAIEKEDFDALQDKTNYCVKNTEYDTPEFLEKYKQAFFEILRPYVVAYYKKGDIPAMPEVCRKATNAHLAVSDEMNAWIDDNYQQDPQASPMSLKSVYEHFKATEAYLSLSKNAKREFNMAKFTEKLASSPFICKYVKRRKETYKGKQLSADSLVGWKLKDDAATSTEDKTEQMEYENIIMEDM